MFISTGMVVESKVSESILDAFKIRTKSLNELITNRLSEKLENTLHDPIKKLKIGTFDTLGKLKTTKTKNKIILLQSSKDLFAKRAIIAQWSSVVLKCVLIFPLVHLPSSLAEAYITFKKRKSLLLLKLEAALEPAKFIKMDHTLIVDDMAYVGQLKHAELIYKEFSTKLLKSVLNTV